MNETEGFGPALQILETSPRYWRIAAESDQVLECISELACPGGAPQNCPHDQEGPMCKVCSKVFHTLDDDGLCTKCPPSEIPPIIAGSALIGFAMLLYPVRIIMSRPPASMQAASRKLNIFRQAVANIGPSKAKSAVTFYQMMMSLDQSFDLSPLSAEYADLLATFSFIEFDWIEVAYPSGCLLGGYTSRLLVVAFAPLCAVVSFPIVLVLCVVLFTFMRSACLSLRRENTNNSTPRPERSSRDRSESIMTQATQMAQIASWSAPMRKMSLQFNINQVDLASAANKLRSTISSRRVSSQIAYESVSKWTARALGFLPIILFVVFVLLPSVSRSIFAVWDCVAYKTGPLSEVSFLRRDLSVECGNPEHNQMVAVALFLVGVWPIGMQVAFFSTLYFNRKELKAGVQTPHTSAIKFLTGGYKPDFFYCARTARPPCPANAITWPTPIAQGRRLNYFAV
jgi:hypothetical protein